MKGNRFFKKKGINGVLLVHGLTSSTDEMEELANYLYLKGYTVLATLLRGHNTSIANLNRTKWTDWYSSVEEDFNFLRKKCDKIFVLGLSMGATLSLHLTARKKGSKIKGLILLSPAIFFVNPFTKFAHLLKYIMKYKVKNYSSYYPGRREAYFDIADEKALKGRIAYKKVPIRSIATSLDLIKIVKKEIKDIKVPALIIHSLKDNTIKIQSSRYIYDHLNLKEKKLVYLKNSGHVITMDFDKKKVFKEILDFIKQ